MHPKIWLLIGVAVLTLIIVLLDYSHTGAPSKKAAQAAPNFTFMPFGAKTERQLSDFKGETILINFWASWCMPCVYELPMLINLAKEHPDDLVLVLMSVDDSAENASTFLKKYNLTQSNIYAAWDDKKHISKNLFHTTKYPESVLIAPDFSIQQKIIGVISEEQINSIMNNMKY